MRLLIDNYDSFTFNLFQQIGALAPDIRVIRNDEMTVAEIAALQPEAIILSPGPGNPTDAGVSVAVVQHFHGKVPILGVCMGHEVIVAAFGGKIINAKRLMHGKTSTVTVDQNVLLFKGCPAEFTVARYHSLVADEANLPANLHVLARTADDEIMAVGDPAEQLYGVQFHPESVMTDANAGNQMIKNFLAMKVPNLI